MELFDTTDYEIIKQDLTPSWEIEYSLKIPPKDIFNSMSPSTQRYWRKGAEATIVYKTCAKNKQQAIACFRDNSVRGKDSKITKVIKIPVIALNQKALRRIKKEKQQYIKRNS